MYCKKCGYLLNEGDKFCPKCGTKIENQHSVLGENDFVPPFRRSTDVTDDLQESRPKRNFQFEEFNWDLDGYPSESRLKKTEEIDFNWESVMDERNKKRREEGVGEVPSFLEKKEEKKQGESSAAESSVHATEAASEPDREKTLEEEIFGDAGLSGGSMSQTKVVDGNADLGKTTKIDKFYTYNKKNEEFQTLLDQEYNRLKMRPDGEESEETDYKEAAAKIESEVSQNEKPVCREKEAAVSEVPEVQVVKAVQGSTPEYIGVVIPETPANVIAFDQELKPEEKIDESEETTAVEAIEEPVAEPEENETIEKEKNRKEVAAEADKAGGAAGPVDNKLTFGDVFADEDEAPEREKPKKHTGLKVLAVILCILMIAMIVVICIKTLAPQSAAAMRIQEIYSSIAGTIGSIFR